MDDVYCKCVVRTIAYTRSSATCMSSDDSSNSKPEREEEGGEEREVSIEQNLCSGLKLVDRVGTNMKALLCTPSPKGGGEDHHTCALQPPPLQCWPI